MINLFVVQKGRLAQEQVEERTELLQHKPTKRLGVVKGGAAEIKKVSRHTWKHGNSGTRLQVSKVGVATLQLVY